MRPVPAQRRPAAGAGPPDVLAKSTSLPSLHRPRKHLVAESHDVAGAKPQSLVLAGKKALSLSPSHGGKLLSRNASAGAEGLPTLSGRMLSQGFWGAGPPRAGAYHASIPENCFARYHAFEASLDPATKFRRFYERGDIPIAVRHGAKPGVEWRVEPERLDYMHFLPMFLDGLLEKTMPYDMLALRGVEDMLSAASGKDPSLIAPTIPCLIVPLKRCLNTKDPEILRKTIGVLQLLIRSDSSVGALLVPYYRQILPVFNQFRADKRTEGRESNLGTMIQETLELLERTGGEDAFINIKYMIPTYESVAA